MFTVIWVWRRLVARYLGVVEAAGSNPVTQTKRPLLERGAVLCFYRHKRAAWQVQSRSFDFRQMFTDNDEYPYIFRAFLKFLLAD